MKTKIFALLLVVAISVLAFASCGGDQGGNGGNSDNNGECQHTFSEAWSNDATNHWYAATCEHGEIKDSLAKHADTDEDGKCDVCEYEVGHDHTYSSEWTNDENNHWKSATCSHKDEKKDFDLHSDEDMNGSCDLCGGHVHKTNNAGFCVYPDCGKQVVEIDETDLTAIINAVVSQKYLVNGGSISYDFKGPSNTGAAYVADKLDTVTYIFGKDNFTYVKVASESVNGGVKGSGYYETWHQLVAPEETFGVVRENGEELVLAMSDPGRLDGYYIALSTLAGDYGVENTLYALYEAAMGDVIGELEIYPDTAENKFTFKYNYKTVFVNHTDVTTGEGGRESVYNVNYFEVEVTLTYSDEYAVTGLDIIVYSYTNDPGTADGYGFLEPDVDLDYDPVTDTFTLRENALANVYTISIKQTLGERTEVNPYPQSDFVPEDFEFYLTETQDEETGEYTYSDKVTEVIKADVKQFIKLYFRDYEPSNTSVHFVRDIVSYKLYKDGILVIEDSGYFKGDYSHSIAYLNLTYHGDQTLFQLMPKEKGAYKLVVYIGDDAVKEVNINVGDVEEENFEIKENQFAVNITETYAWTNEYTFTAKQAGTYTFTLPAGIGFVDADAFDAAEKTDATDDSPAPYFDYQLPGNDNGGSFSLTLEAGQEIRLYASATEARTYVITYEVN